MHYSITRLAATNSTKRVTLSITAIETSPRASYFGELEDVGYNLNEDTDQPDVTDLTFRRLA